MFWRTRSHERSLLFFVFQIGGMTAGSLVVRKGWPGALTRTVFLSD